MLKSKHREINKKKYRVCYLQMQMNEEGNYVSHSCKVDLSEIVFFPTIGNVSARRKTIYGVYNIKVVLQDNRDFI